MHTYDFNVGDMVVYTMWTDTRGYEVVKVTPKSIVIRPTDTGEIIRSENRDGNPWPCVFREMLPDPTSDTVRCVRRKDGSFRVASWARPLRPAPVIEGKPCTFTDYRE